MRARRSVAIGQGAVWLTPIGLMQLASFVGNEGVVFKPQIVNRIVSPEGKVVKVFEPIMTANVKLNKHTFAIVKDAMKGVVNEPGGTAYANARSRVVSISGKTGSAQSGTGGATMHCSSLTRRAILLLSPWVSSWNTAFTAQALPPPWARQ